MQATDWQKLASYFSNELTPTEEQEVLAWATAHPENQEALEQARKIWEKSSQPLPAPAADTDQEWERLKIHLLTDTPETAVKPLHPTQPLRHWWAAAAIFLMLSVGLGYWFTRSGSAPVTMIASGDSVRVIYLPDSSRVSLNHHSQLTYSSDYNQSVRAVTLTGQAFFEVKRDPARPFIIQTSHTQTKVLGTSFDLKAYPDEPRDEIIVHSGRVSFTSLRDTAAQQVVLLPDDEGTYDRASGVVHKNHISQRTAWWLKKSAQYEQERVRPRQFLRVTADWHKNFLNQTVIEGKLQNTASRTAYTAIRLRYVVHRKKGKRLTHYITIAEVLKPGESVSYKRKLMDMFSKTSQVTVEVTEASPLQP